MIDSKQKLEATVFGDLSPEAKALIQRRRQTARPSPLERIDRERIERLPLSFAQQRLWFLEQMEGKLTAYNMPFAWRLRGSLNPEALRRALEAIVRRHEPLRTTFAVVDEEPVQVIGTIERLELPLEDLRGLETDQQAAEIVKRCGEEAERPFDLTSDLMLRASLLRLAEDEHVLLLTIHHIASDGWSMQVVFWRELRVLYDAYRRDADAGLPDLSVQYTDYAVWQRKQLKGERLTGLLQYWREQLDGLSALEIPTDRVRPRQPSYRGSRHDFTLGPELIRQLRSLCQAEGVTLHMTLLAAFQALLSRYSGQDDVAVGTPIAGRNHAALEGLIGFFVNTLVLRTDLSDDPTFRELLGRVLKVSLAAYDHQDLPFEKLVEELRPERSLSRSPLVQVLFQLLSISDQGLNLRELEVTRLPQSGVRVRFDLEMQVWQPAEKEESFRGAVIYSTDLFDTPTIERLVGHFLTLLESIVADADQRISDLKLLTEAERQELLVQWNDTTVDYPRDGCVHHLFEEQVERTPGAVAVVFEGQELTYRELNERANQLAHHLRSRGVGPETLVGLCLERSPELVIGILGILKAGGAYVPLDADYPPQRLEFMLGDAAVNHLVAQKPLLDRLPRIDCSVTCLGTEAVRLDACDRSNPSVDVVADNLAYVMYTSGSTGKPKGVAMTHAALVNLIDWHRHDPHLMQSARTLQFASCNFDVSFQEMLTTWSCGGTLVLISAVARRDPSVLWKVIVEARVERLFAPFVALQQLATIANGTDAQLRDIISAGETLQLTPEIRHLVQHLSNCRLHNHYGPTESHVVTSLLLSNESSTWPSEAPIGRPIANTQVYVLDKKRQLVPIGVVGELYIGGVCLARGYLNRPELTAERFVANPFDDASHARFYRTGDLCRWLADGNLEFLGRIDDQVKLRGFRIELGEIEAVLQQHSSVAQSVVVLREDRLGDKRLVAYCVSAGSAPLDVTDLTRHLRTQLPDYMVPSVLVLLEAFPLSPNGKVNRRALPEPDDSRPQLESLHVAPRTPIEELLATIWADLLMLERVGIHDNFFDLGGHSLLATRVVSRVRQSFSVELPLRSLFDAPTIAGLADQLQNLQSTSRSQAPQIQPVSRVGRLPLSFAQQRLWFLDRYESDRAVYNIPYALRLLGPLEVDRLRASLTRIVHRHEALRTSIATVEGEPFQVIAASLEVDVPVLDLSHLPEEEREEQARTSVLAEARRPFNLASGPLVRTQLIRLSALEHLLLLSLHHIISDGWSISLLLGELKEYYRSLSEGVEARVAELPLHYADYAVWQRQWLQGGELDRQAGYWKERLSRARALLELPTDHPRPALQSYCGACELMQLSPTLSDKLKVFSRREGVTLFMTLVAGFKVLLSRYSGQEDVVIGSLVAGRTRREFEHLIGFFVNTLALRTDLSGDPTVRELLVRVREVAMGAYAHQDLPFEKLVEELRPPRSLSYSPLIQVLFVLQNTPRADMEIAGLEMRREAVHSGTSKFDITLAVEETSAGLRGAFEYNTDLFDEGTIRRMAGHYQRLLEGIVTYPEQPISQLPLLTEDERHQMLVQWDDSARGYPADRCVHQLFEEQVGRTPEAVAVVFENQQLTYRELNARSNQLAHYLRDLGVGPEMLVAICLERSLEMVVGLLGILKAGGAYVPLDPEYPAERLAFLLRDSDAAVLLTQNRLLPSLPDCAARVLCLDADASTFADMSDANPPPLATPDDLAYVIYTSGSTGAPKGVLVSHDNVVRLFRATQPWFEFDRRDVWTLFHSFAFDFSVWEIWGALVHGGRLVVVPSRVTRSPHEFYQLLLDERVTVLNQTPSAFRPLIAADQAARGDGDLSLRLVIFGGEALELESLRSWFMHHGDQKPQLVNMYGITETTVHVTYRPLRLADLNDAPGSVIGRPIPDLRLYVLESNGQPAPLGVPGEICVGGAGVARGYLNRPELTAQKFIPDPFRGEPEARLYRSGDLARYLPDGDIEYLGRIDQQVKIRGYRIELGEVEAVLGQHPQVRDRAVVARRDSSGENRLVAYVVPRDSVALTYGQLRDYLKPKLPAYMIPSALVVLDAFPLTANGKLDRRALPEPDGKGAVVSGGYTAPRTEVEERLALMWAEALGLERVGIHDNFFELGGHSLMATGLFSRIEAEFKRSVPLGSLFRAQTIAELAVTLTNAPVSDSYRSTLVIEGGKSRRPTLFLVHGMDGDVGHWRPLIEHLGSDIDVYGLKLPEIAGTYQPFSSLEAMAAYHVEWIYQTQPDGPYHIAGYSFGGRVALEIAQQLVSAGRPVGLLVAIDSGPFPQSKYDWKSFSLYRFITNLYNWLADDLLKTPLRELLDRVRLKIKTSARRMGLLSSDLPASSPLHSLHSWLDLEHLPDQRRSLIETNYLAWQSYLPRAYPGRVTLFRARTRPLLHSLSPDLGWAEIAREGVDIRVVAGHHWSIMVEPNVQNLADQLRTCLKEAEPVSFSPDKVLSARMPYAKPPSESQEQLVAMACRESQ